MLTEVFKDKLRELPQVAEKAKLECPDMAFEIAEMAKEFEWTAYYTKARAMASAMDTFGKSLKPLIDLFVDGGHNMIRGSGSYASLEDMLETIFNRAEELHVFYDVADYNLECMTDCGDPNSVDAERKREKAEEMRERFCEQRLNVLELAAYLEGMLLEYQENCVEQGA